jgi:hypothetical protein
LGRGGVGYPDIEIFQSKIVFVSPMKDFLFTRPAEIKGFLINLLYVSGGFHYTIQVKTVNETEGVP